VTSIVYNEGAELPDQALDWRDYNNDVINFSSGWTFTVMAVSPSATTTLSTTTVVGAATSPNATISFSTADLAALTQDTDYRLIVRANRTSDSRDRDFPGPLTLRIRSLP